jgi:hypothetical protein
MNYSGRGGVRNIQSGRMAGRFEQAPAQPEAKAENYYQNADQGEAFLHPGLHLHPPAYQILYNLNYLLRDLY